MSDPTPQEIAASFNATNVAVTVEEGEDNKFSFFQSGPQTGFVANTDGTVDIGGVRGPRSYLFTWVTPFGEESMPSRPSEAVYSRVGEPVIVRDLPISYTSPDAKPRLVRGIRLYRSVSAPSGTEYFRLATLWFPNDVLVGNWVGEEITIESRWPHALIPGDRIQLPARYGSAPHKVIRVENRFKFVCEAPFGNNLFSDIVEPFYYDVSEDPTDDNPFYWGLQNGDLAAGEFLDDFDQLSLTRILPSLDYEPPPDELRGLVLLPTNIMAGFVGSNLYFSEPGQYHAWPPDNVVTLEHKIVGLAVSAGTLVVLTDGYPYRVDGNTPESMQPSKIESMFPCLSKKSIVSTGMGVIYSTHSGLALYNPSQGANRITQFVLDRQDWKEFISFRPELLSGFEYEDKYIGSLTAGAVVPLWGQFFNNSYPTVSSTSFVRAVAYSPDGKLLALGNVSSTYLYQVLRTDNWSQVFSGDTSGSNYAITFSPDGTVFAVGNSFDLSVGETAPIRFYASSNGQLVNTIGSVSDGVGVVFSISYSPNGQFVAIGTSQGSRRIRVYRIADNSEVQELPSFSTAWVRSVTFSPNGQYLAAATDTGFVFIYDTNTWQQVTSFSPPPSGISRACSFSPDGTLLAVASRIDLHVYDTATWQRVTNGFKSLGGFTFDCHFSPDGTKLAVAFEVAPFVRLYDVATLQEIPTNINLPAAARACRFSPDSKQLAVGGDEYATVINLDEADTDQPTGMFAFENDQQSGGILTFLDINGKQFVSGWTDPSSGDLYVNASGNAIEQFDEGNNLLMTWQSKDYRFPVPMSLGAVQVYTDDAGSGTMDLRVDSVFRSTVETESYTFSGSDLEGVIQRLPLNGKYDEFSFRLSASFPVQTIRFATTPAELRNV